MVDILKPMIVEASMIGATMGVGPPISKIDFQSTYEIAMRSQTILFSSEQMLALGSALNRYSDASEYRLPFPQMIIQFTKPIPETTFLHGAYNTGVEEIDPFAANAKGEDLILAMLLAQAEGSGEIDATAAGKIVNNAILFYASTSVNRSAWYGTGTATEKIDASQARTAEQVEDKEAIRRMAIAVVTYINCVNIELVRQETPEKVAKKRRKRGKPVPEPWYECHMKEPDGRVSRPTGTGSHHGHRYDVRGHFRRLQSGKTTWVKAHQRGLDHDLYVPKVYKKD